MGIQNLILGALRRAPHSLIAKMAGQPIEVDGHVMDANIQILANMAAKQAANGPPPPTDLSDKEALSAFRDGANAFDPIALPRRRGVSVEDVVLPLATGELRARIYAPKKASSTDPCILFFHQGGLVVMHHLTDDYFCSVLADECRAKVISLDYRLCPEHGFPAPIEDGLALWDYVHEKADELAIDVRRVALAGDSAGGLIASVMCQVLRDRGQEDKFAPQPAAQLLVYPWVSTDMNAGGSVDSCADMFPLNRHVMDLFNQTVFPGGKNMDHAWANPLHNENLQKLPPAIIATAGFDPIRDQGNEYAEALGAVGNQVTHYCFGELTHSFLCLGRVSDAAQEAGVQIARDLAAHLGR